MIASARVAVESLRKGIPPDRQLSFFTIGRKDELKALEAHLLDTRPGGMLLKANYGSGKTHLLKYTRERALAMGYAVSYVVLDSYAEVRFNRMDQMMGAIVREMQLPKSPECKGIGPFFALMASHIDASRQHGAPESFFARLTDNYRWSYSDMLQSATLFVALRAWYHGTPDTRALVEEWLQNPHNFHTQRRVLNQTLITDLGHRFRDSRTSAQLQKGGVFDFRSHNYQNSWATLKDLHVLVKKAGYRGLCILFDEFEDIIYNLGRIDFQEDAFWNLFEFMTGNKYPGKTFFAVTPGFADKCSMTLRERNRSGHKSGRFDKLPFFAMSPLEQNELVSLSGRIIHTHGKAYQWKPLDIIDEAHFIQRLEQWASVPLQDRTRTVIKEIVGYLDDLMERNR